MDASLEGHTSIVQALVDAGANLEASKVREWSGRGAARMICVSFL